MATKVYYPDGREVPADKVGEAIASGNARWKRGDSVTVQREGQRATVASDDIYDAISQGWIPESPAETEVKDFQEQKGGSLAEQAKAFAEGIPGPLLSIPTQALAGDTEYAKNQRLRQSLAGSTAGEITGYLIPLAGEVAGGAKAAGAAGKAAYAASKFTPAGLAEILSRPAGRAIAEALPATGTATNAFMRGAARVGVEGAIEAGTFGSLAEGERQAMEHKFDPEKILAAGVEHGTAGLLVGGGLGGVGGLVGNKVARYIAGKAEKAGDKAGYLDQKLAEQAQKALGITAGDIEKIGGQKALDRITRQAIDEGVLSAEGGIEGRIGRIIAKHKDTGVKIGNAYAEAGAIPEGVKARMIKRLDAWLESEAARGGKYTTSARALRKDWLSTTEPVTTYKGLHEIAKDLFAETKRNNLDKIIPAQAKRFSDKFRVALYSGLEETNPVLAASVRELNDEYKLLTPFVERMGPKAEKIAFKGTAAVTPIEGAFAIGSLTLGNPALATASLARAGLRQLQTNPEVNALIARGLTKLSRAVDGVDKVLSDSVTSATREAVKHTLRNAPNRAWSLAEQYEEHRRAANAIKTNPDGVANQVGMQLTPLTEVDPDAARKVIATKVADMQWLSSIVPQLPQGMPQPPPDRSGKTPQQKTTGIPRSEAASFVRASDGLNDMVGEMKKVGQRKVGPSPEAIEAMHQRRPSIQATMATMFDSAAVQLAAEGKVLPYPVRLQATKITGKSYDFSLDPAYIAACQARYRAARQAKMDAANGSGPSPGPRRKTPAETRQRLDQYMTGAQENMDEGE